MFINENDKQIIRVGAYVMFLEQLVEQQRKEIEGAKSEITKLKKELENAKIQSDVSEQTSESASAASATIQGSDPSH